MSPTACRSPRNWSGAKYGCRIFLNARGQIEARAKERFVRDQAEHHAKIAAREAKIAKPPGKKPGGFPPEPPVRVASPTDQINLTDGEPRIMPVPGGGFEQCYNAQAVVAEGSLLVVASDVVQAANDKQQLKPMLATSSRLCRRARRCRRHCWRQGYFSEGNVAPARRKASIHVARGRSHHPSLASALPRRRPRRRSQRRSKPWAIGWRRLKARSFMRAQTDTRTGVRHHQIGAGLPAIPAAWAGQGAWRMETRDHGLEHEANVRPRHSVRERRTLRNQPPRDRPKPLPPLPRRQPLHPIQRRLTKRNAAFHRQIR